MELTTTQKQAIEVWENNIKDDRRVGVLELPTGFGKTLIGKEIAKKYNKILITSPTLHLLEHWKYNLRDEIDKDITYLTNQSAHKLVKAKYELLIMDEFHHIPAPVYINLLRNNDFKNVLGLTSDSSRTDKRDLIAEKEFGLKVIFKAKHSDGIKENLLSKYNIINISVEQTEQEERELLKVEDFISKHFKSYGFNFDTVRKLSARDATAIELMRCFNYRKSLLANAENKLKKIHEILSNNTFKKAIIFTEYIENANTILVYLKDYYDNIAVYHSKSQDRDLVLDNFRNDKLNILISVKALDEGLNIPQADLAIISSATQQQRQMSQRLGRILRYQEGKIANVYSLYCRNTKEEQWIKRRIKGLTGYEKIVWEE